MKNKVIVFLSGERIVVVLGVLLVVFAALPLFHPGFFSMHDDEQVGRLYEFDQGIKQGYIPPRISQNLGFGFGYPFFNFYPPFVYYVAEVFRLFGASYIVSLKMMLLLGFILSFFFMYLFSREYFGRLGGIVSAVVYSYAPYHAVDIYVRGAFPEFWSFVFIPALFWSYLRLSVTLRTRYLLYAAAFGVCLILTHNLMAMISGLFLLPYVIFLLLRSKRKKVFAVKAALSGILALFISAYFWIPSFFERKYTMVDLLTKELADYNLHFVYLEQFWNSPWGYGGSTAGLSDGLSFQLGKMHILLMVLVLVATTVRIILRRAINKLYLLFFFLFFLSLFMQISYSKFIWDFLPPFWYIQFPWRFLVISAFFSATIIGMAFHFISDKKWRLVVACCLVVIIILFNSKYFKPQTYYSDVKDEHYTSREFLRWDTSRLAFEYVPKGIATKKSSVGNTVVDIDKNEIAKNSYGVVSGKMNVTVVKDLYQNKEFKIQVEKAGLFRINTYSFPGWEVNDNGSSVTYSDANKLKLITIPVSAGEHEVITTFNDTPVRRIANLLSLTTFGGLIIFTTIQLINSKRKKFT